MDNPVADPGSPLPHEHPQDPAPVVALFGGRSEVGLEVVTRLAPGHHVVLLARPGDLSEQVRRCRQAGAVQVSTLDFDADDTDSHDEVLARIESLAGAVEVAVLAFGILGDQQHDEHDHRATVQVLHTDFVAQASLLTVLAVSMRARGHGTLVAFSSVAGMRVRRANYVYGSAKAGLDGFACGMADALHGSGVRLVLARPGFIIGRMTRGMDPAVFSSTPDQVGAAVARAVRGHHHGPLWIPWQLRAMFSLTPFVPRSLWRRMPR